MNSRQLLNLGVPLGKPMKHANHFIANNVLKGGDRAQIETRVTETVSYPESFLNAPLRGSFANSLLEGQTVLRTNPVPYRQWGKDLEKKTDRLRKAIEEKTPGHCTPQGGHSRGKGGNGDHSWFDGIARVSGTGQRQRRVVEQRSARCRTRDEPCPGEPVPELERHRSPAQEKGRHVDVRRS